MPPTGKSPRRKLPYLETTDAPAVHEAGQLLADALDNDCETGQGKLSERPEHGTRGRLYFVTGDTASNNGILWWDSGSTWVAIGAEIPSPKAVLTSGFHEGSIIVEQVASTPANMVVSWRGRIEVWSGATTELGVTLRILKDGAMVEEKSIRLVRETSNPEAIGFPEIAFTSTGGGSHTWKVEAVAFGTAVGMILHEGVLSFR